MRSKLHVEENQRQVTSPYLVRDLFVLRGKRAQRQEPHAGHAALVVDLVVRESLGVFLPPREVQGGTSAEKAKEGKKERREGGRGAQTDQC